MAKRFQHDCSCCIFVGQHNGQDLYYCPSGGVPATVIARRSDEPSDYSSGMVFAVRGDIEELKVALNRAVELGLCDENGAPKNDKVSPCQ
jgi:hypothetical protein